jgi:hypothetical protein
MLASDTVSYGKRTESSTTVPWNPQNCNYLFLWSPASHFQHFWFFVVVIWTWTRNQALARHYLHRTTQEEGKHTSMPQVEFKPMISVFQKHRKVCALCQEATVISLVTTSTICYCYPKMSKTMT